MTPEETLRQALLEDKFPESDEKPIVPIADPLKYNRMTAVSAWMGNLTGQDISPEDIGWQAEKDALAQEFFKMPDAKDVTDETVHDLIRSHIQTSDNAKSIALDSALSGRSFSQTLNEVQAFTGVSKTRGIRDRYVNEASNLYGNVAARVAPYRAMINNVAGTLSKEMESALPTTDAFQKAADALLLVPVEDRALVINAIGKTGGATAEERASYLSKISGAIGRMSEQMGSSVESAMSEAALTETVAQLQEAGQMGFAKKMEAETDRQDEFRLLTQMVRDVANSEISPIKGDGVFSQLGIDLARMIPQSAVSVANPAMGFAANVAYFDATQTAQAMMEDPRLSLKQARASVALSAPISAAAETITALIPFGKVKLPFFSKWIQATTTSTGAALRNLGVRAATGTAGEITEEYVQSAAPLISQELLGVLSADMPDVDWENRMPDFSKVAAETWAPALVFSLIGAGATSISDIKNGRSLAADLDMMVASGVNPELAGKIKAESEAGNWSQVDSLFREEFVSKSKATAPDIQAATERLKARFRDQSSIDVLQDATSPEYTAKVIRTPAGWQVQTGDGNVVTTETKEAADQIYSKIRQVGNQKEAEVMAEILDGFYAGGMGRGAQVEMTGETVGAAGNVVSAIRRDAGGAPIAGSARVFDERALEEVRAEAAAAGFASGTQEVFARINGSNEVFPQQVGDTAKGIWRILSLFESRKNATPQVATLLHEDIESKFALGLINKSWTVGDIQKAFAGLLPAFANITAPIVQTDEQIAKMSKSAQEAYYAKQSEFNWINNVRNIVDGKFDAATLRETFSEMYVRDRFALDRKGLPTGLPAGSISRGIEASIMGATTQEEAGIYKRFRAMFKAFSAHFKAVFKTVQTMVAARKEGKIGEDWDSFVNKVLGIDEVKQMESQAIDEGMAMLGVDEEAQAVIDAGNMAFSISPALLSMQPPEGITVNTTDALPSWTIPKVKGDSPKVLNSAKARSEFYGKLDKAIAWLKADPTKIVSSEGWVTFMKMAGISGEIPLPPSGLTDIINNPAEYVKKLNGGYHAAASLTDTQTSAKQGMDGTVETRNLIGEGKAPAPFVVALHNMWGILSRMLSPIDQEGMWLRLISHRPVLDAIQSSIDGNFALTVKQWKQVVQDARAATAIESGKVGNAATSNANAFYLMLSRLNGKWSKMADVYSAPNSREMGRRFWDVGAGKLGIKNKVQRFIGLTFGIPGVIMDRWKFVEFWLPDAMEGMGAKQPSDYFKYSQNTPSDPVGIYGVYGGIDSGNETLSLAMYEAFETVLEESIRKSPELQKHLGVHSNAGGMHWFGWNAIKNEAVGHSSLDLTKDLIKAFGDKVNADQVYETITNGTYYTEGSPAAGVNVKFILKQGGVRVERTGVAGGSKPRQSRGKPRGGRGGAAEGGAGIAGVGQTFSISPAQDAEYLDLAKDPEKNRSLLQRMVDAVAKAAGYMVEAWHGSPDFKGNIFDRKFFGRNTGLSRGGFSFTTDREAAVYYMSGEVEESQAMVDSANKVMAELQTRIDQGLEWKGPFDEYAPPEFRSDLVDDIDEIAGYLRSIAKTLPSDLKQKLLEAVKLTQTEATPRLIHVYLKNPTVIDVSGKELLQVTDSSQIKSADPVTYDADGNIILLSQRFNEATPDIRFSISPVRNLNELSDQVEKQFAENPVGALEVKSRVIRQFAKLADKWSNERWTPQGNKIRPISEKRTVKSLDKEQAMRQAQREVELVNEGMDKLTPDTLMAYSEGVGTLQDDPLIARMLNDNGKLMSKATAEREGRGIKDQYDDAGWIPPQWYAKAGGIMPDVMANNLGFDYASEMWAALESSIKSHRTAKAGYAKAEDAVKAVERAAFEQARKEAQAWRTETDAMQKEDWSPRESLVRDLITLEAIIAMFPQEIRGKIGGFVALARKASEAARLKVLQKQLERGQVLLEKHLKEQYGEATDKLLKRFKSQKDASGRITGKIISTATEQVDYAAEFIKLGIEEQADRQAALEKKVEESENADDVQDALTKLGIARLFDMYSDKDSASRESAFIWLNDTIEAGKLGKSIVDEARKEMLTEMRQSAQSSILAGDELNPDIADNITNLNKGVFKRALLNLRGMLSEALWTTIQRLELIFGEDSKILNHFAEKIINAANLSTDIKRLVEAQKKDALSIIFNSDSKFAHARGIAELQKVKQSGISTRRVKKEEVKLDIETLTKLNDGTMSAETAGLRQDEVDAALEEFAANARKSTVTIEKVINAGTPVERMMSETQGIQWWLWSMQDASRKQMERDGWDADSFKQLEEFLSPEAKALGRWISGSYQDAAGMIDPIYRKLFNAPLPRTKNYSPIHRRNMNTGGDIMDIDGSDMNSGLAAGFTKARVNTTASLVEMDALAVFLAHWENVSHWVSHAELMRDMKAILLDKDTAVAIRQKKSEGYLQRLKEDVKTIEKNGTNSASELVNISRVWRWFMQYRSYKGLAFRLSPIIKQTPALLNPLIADVPAHNYMMGMARAFIEPQTFAREVSAMWTSDIIRRRIEAGFSAESRVAMQGAGMTGSQAIVAMQAGMMPMSMVDGGWTALGAAISFDYYRRGYMRDNPQMTPEIADAKAIARVEKMIATSAQPSDVYARSLSERSGNPFMKSMSMFVSDQRKALAIELMAIRRLATGKSKNKTLDIQRAFVAHFVQAGVSQVMAVVIASLLGDDEDRDRELSREQWTLALALGPINGLFVFGRLADKIGRGLLGLRVFPADDLASKVANDLLKGGKNMDELFNPDDADDFMDALDSSSTALGAGMSAAIGPAGGAVDVGANLLREARKIQKRLSE